MSFNIETKCVQSGYTPKNGEPRVVPIVQSTTYKYESSEQMGRLFVRIFLHPSPEPDKRLRSREDSRP